MGADNGTLCSRPNLIREFDRLPNNGAGELYSVGSALADAFGGWRSLAKVGAGKGIMLIVREFSVAPPFRAVFFGLKTSVRHRAEARRHELTRLEE